MSSMQAAPSSASQRVTDDVGVGVALEPVRVRDLDAAEHERPAGHEAVRVEGRADAELSQAAPRAARGAEHRDRAVAAGVRRAQRAVVVAPEIVRHVRVGAERDRHAAPVERLGRAEVHVAARQRRPR